MKTINGQAIDTGTTFICINHLAQSIGSYIPTENPTGGRAPIYLSDIIIKLTKKSSEFEKMKAGQKVEFEAIKSRYGAGKAKVPFYIRFGQGIAMIPTYREVLESVTYNGKPILELRGGGNGSLYLNDTEYKFRGDNQLLELIAKNYSVIKSIVPDNIFEVQPPDLPTWAEVDSTLEATELKLPEELLELPVVFADTTQVYFDKGVDVNGAPYYISYEPNNSDRLTLYYDGAPKELINRHPTLANYKKLKKKLDQFLKEVEKN